MQTEDEIFSQGRAVFMAMEGATCDNYSLVTTANLDAARQYGESQIILLSRGRKVLRAVRRALASRAEMLQ